MNGTLKNICALIQNHGDPELQIAAIRVLSAIHAQESGIYKILGEELIQSESPEVFHAILTLIENNPHEQSLRFLLEALERDTGHQDRILATIAQIGGKAVAGIRLNFDKISSPTQHQLVTVLPQVRTAPAHSFLVECCFHSDHELVRQAVHSIREEMHRYSPKEKNDLFQKLLLALDDKRLRVNEAALSALIISLGIVADIRCKDKLLSFTAREHPQQIRRHALMSLARMDFIGEKHAKAFKILLPILNETDYEGLVRHAIAVLQRIKPRRQENKKIQDLLKNRHIGVQCYALRALGMLDSITNAENVLTFLSHPDAKLRDAACESLRLMPSAVKVILRHLDEVTDKSRAIEMVKILEGHGNRIKPEQAKDMVKHMLELSAANDDHYQLYLTALRHLRGDVLQAELVRRATAARKKKDFEKIRDVLKLLDGTELLTPEIRFQLAIAKLKTSKKDRSRAFRLSDYCLEHMVHLLRDDPKGFKKKFIAERCLDAEDFLYVGFHFSERLNEERRFGADMLRHVIKKWPRKKAAQVAKNKLRVEGH